jgi:uncharacterized protein YsxB (DUF464 family)
MITIVLKEIDGHFVSLEAKGHANTAPYGADLVCAAVSAVILGGFNALEEENAYEAKASEGYASLKAKKVPSEHDAIVISTLITQLTSLAESHPESVKLERK